MATLSVHASPLSSGQARSLVTVLELTTFPVLSCDRNQAAVTKEGGSRPIVQPRHVAREEGDLFHDDDDADASPDALPSPSAHHPPPDADPRAPSPSSSDPSAHAPDRMIADISESYAKLCRYKALYRNNRGAKRRALADLAVHERAPPLHKAVMACLNTMPVSFEFKGEFSFKQVTASFLALDLPNLLG